MQPNLVQGGNTPRLFHILCMFLPLANAPLRHWGWVLRGKQSCRVLFSKPVISLPKPAFLLLYQFLMFLPLRHWGRVLRGKQTSRVLFCHIQLSPHSRCPAHAPWCPLPFTDRAKLHPQQSPPPLPPTSAEWPSSDACTFCLFLPPPALSAMAGDYSFTEGCTVESRSCRNSRMALGRLLVLVLVLLSRQSCHLFPP